MLPARHGCLPKPLSRCCQALGDPYGQLPPRRLGQFRFFGAALLDCFPVLVTGLAAEGLLPIALAGVLSAVLAADSAPGLSPLSVSPLLADVPFAEELTLSAATRALADRLGVTVGTITRAYGEAALRGSANAFDQNTKGRRAPTFRPTLD